MCLLHKQSNSILRIIAANKVMRLVYFAHNVAGVSLHVNRKLISRLPMKDDDGGAGEGARGARRRRRTAHTAAHRNANRRCIQRRVRGESCGGERGREAAEREKRIPCSERRSHVGLNI